MSLSISGASNSLEVVKRHTVLQLLLLATKYNASSDATQKHQSTHTSTAFTGSDSAVGLPLSRMGCRIQCRSA